MNTYLLAAASGWLVAESSKFLLKVMKDRRAAKPRRHRFGQSGDMPSSHAATTWALAAAILLADGVTSAISAVAVIFAIVTTHDAMRVRRAVGEHGPIVSLLLDKALPKQAKPYFAKGHTPSEVLVGAALGLLCGTLISLLC